jgi:ribosomal protein S18 acetylase RimI-like enzyme
MKRQYKIRRARDEDGVAALSLIAVLGYGDVDGDAFESVFKTLTARDDGALLVAEDDGGKIVGLATVSWRLQLRLTGMLVSIDELVVDSRTRGAGIGKALLDEVKAIASRVAEAGGMPWRLQLETRRTRESYLREFYAKNGFREVDSALMRYVTD